MSKVHWTLDACTVDHIWNKYGQLVGLVAACLKCNSDTWHESKVTHEYRAEVFYRRIDRGLGKGEK